MNKKIVEEMSDVELELERNKIENDLKYSMQDWWLKHSKEQTRLSKIQFEIGRRKEPS